jgi:predicted transcriptional regulator
LLRALAVGSAKFSRAISDLVRAGLVRRHYAGYATNYANHGGGRHAVYVVEPDILAARGKSVGFASSFPQGQARQGQLFAA